MKKRSIKMKKRLLSLALIGAMTITMLVACGKNETSASTETAATANVEKSMVIGDTTFNAENWEETINPHVTYNGWPCIRYGVGETLVHYTDTMELEPWLATSWENDGDKVWTITLRDGVKFSSGRDMDAEAVKQCFEHMAVVFRHEHAQTQKTCRRSRTTKNLDKMNKLLIW